MVGRLAGAWSACIDWTLWSGSERTGRTTSADKTDRTENLRTLEQSVTNNIPHICHIIPPANFANKTDRAKNLYSRAQLRKYLKLSKCGDHFQLWKVTTDDV